MPSRLSTLGPLAVLGLLTLTSPARAQEGPSFDCAAATHEVERLICSDAELAARDRRLQSRFEAALSGAEQAGPDAVSLLRTIQRGWIKGRNDCWKAHDVRGCVEGNMLWRDAELVADWSLIAPRSAEVYDCGDPAEEVRVTFFETEVPSVRLRRGDESVAAVLDLQAADMTYVAEDGSTFTLGADDPDHGALQWPGGPEEMCSRR